MKKSLFLISILIFSLGLLGCARNDLNKNDVRDRARIVTNNNARNNVNNAGNNVRNNVIDDRNNIDDNNRSRMSVADAAAKKIADMPEVDGANVITTENNAYVAVKLANSTQNTGVKKLEHQIVQKVKSTDRDIDNVYVSENPDFYDRMSTYANDIRNGRPISGFFNEFTETVRRVFPKAK